MKVGNHPPGGFFLMSWSYGMWQNNMSIFNKVLYGDRRALGFPWSVRVGRLLFFVFVFLFNVYGWFTIMYRCFYFKIFGAVRRTSIYSHKMQFDC
jgi:hypothetical protein